MGLLLRLLAVAGLTFIMALTVHIFDIDNRLAMFFFMGWAAGSTVDLLWKIWRE